MTNFTNENDELVNIFTAALFCPANGYILIMRYYHHDLSFSFHQYEAFLIENLKNEAIDFVEDNDVLIATTSAIGSLDDSAFMFIYTLPCGSNQIYVGGLSKSIATDALQGLPHCIITAKALSAYSKGKELLKKMTEQLEEANASAELSLSPLRISKIFFDEPEYIHIDSLLSSLSEAKANRIGTGISISQDGYTKEVRWPIANNDSGENNE